MELGDRGGAGPGPGKPALEREGLELLQHTGGAGVEIGRGSGVRGAGEENRA